MTFLLGLGTSILAEHGWLPSVSPRALQEIATDLLFQARSWVLVRREKGAVLIGTRRFSRLLPIEERLRRAQIAYTCRYATGRESVLRVPSVQPDQEKQASLNALLEEFDPIACQGACRAP